MLHTRRLVVGLVLIVGIAALVALGSWAVIAAQNPKKPQPAPEKPVQIQPLPARPVPIRPVPERANPDDPVGAPPGGGPAGGGGVNPVVPQIGVVPQRSVYEYRVVEFVGRDTDEHAKTLNTLAAEGWEYVGIINLFATQTNGTTNGQPSALVAFRRLKAQPIRPVPIPIPNPAGIEPGIEVLPAPAKPVKTPAKP